MDLQRQEQETLQNKVSKFLDDKTGSTILLRGELGNGKSKIVNDVLEFQENNFSKNIISVNYEADELFHGEDLSFDAWEHLIRDIEISFCNYSFDGKSRLNKSEYTAIVQKIFSEGGIDWLRWIPLFGDISEHGLISITEAHNLYKSEKTTQEMDKQLMLKGDRTDIFEQMKSYLLKVIYKIPAIIVIKNIQWADNTSLEFLGYLCRYIKKNSPPLLLILTYSDKEIFGNKLLSKNNFHELFLYLEKYGLFDNIPVGNLDRNKLRKYLTLLKLPYNTDNQFVDKLYELSKGNLFSIGIILKNLSGQEDVSVKSLDSFPESLSEIIEDYLKDLSADAKDLLKSCSIMGETFSMEIVAKLFEFSDKKLEKLVQELVDNTLIVSSKKKIGNLKKIYQFTQSLINKYICTTYDENLKLEKHLQIASLLSDSTNSQIFNIYLHHWGIGHNIINEYNEVIISKPDLEDEEILKNVREYLEQIISLSEKYKLQFVFDEALNLYTKIIFLTNLLDDYETWFIYIINKTEVLQSMGKYNDALQLLNNLTNDNQLNEESTALLELQRGNLYERRDENQQALDHYRKAEKLYEKLNDEFGLGKIYGKIGIIHSKKNDFETALCYYDKKIYLCKKLNLLLEYHKSLGQIGNIHLEKGEFDDAEMIYKKNYDFYSDLEDLKEKMISIGNLGIVYKEKKMFNEAMKCAKEKLELSLKLLDKREEMMANGNIANIYKEQDDFTEAMNYYDKALKISEDIGDIFGNAATLYNVGSIFIKQNKLTEAKDIFLKALNKSKETENKFLQITILKEYLNILINLKEISDIKEIISLGSEIAGKMSDTESIEEFQTLSLKYNTN